MKKPRIIAETGEASTASPPPPSPPISASNVFVYMGTEDMDRQALNVSRMRMLGAEVVGVNSASRTLKDAINEAMRDWVTNVRTTHYLLGSVLGAHPYPTMVRDFHPALAAKPRANSRCGKAPTHASFRLRRRRLETPSASSTSF